jgi:hypothetical protein
MRDRRNPGYRFGEVGEYSETMTEHVMAPRCQAAMEKPNVADFFVPNLRPGASHEVGARS